MANRRGNLVTTERAYYRVRQRESVTLLNVFFGLITGRRYTHPERLTTEPKKKTGITPYAMSATLMNDNATIIAKQIVKRFESCPILKCAATRSDETMRETSKYIEPITV